MILFLTLLCAMGAIFFGWSWHETTLRGSPWVIVAVSALYVFASLACLCAAVLIGIGWRP